MLKQELCTSSQFKEICSDDLFDSVPFKCEGSEDSFAVAVNYFYARCLLLTRWFLCDNLSRPAGFMNNVRRE